MTDSGTEPLRAFALAHGFPGLRGADSHLQKYECAAIGVANPVAVELWLAVNAARYWGGGGRRVPHRG